MASMTARADERMSDSAQRYISPDSASTEWRSPITTLDLEHGEYTSVPG